MNRHLCWCTAALVVGSPVTLLAQHPITKDDIIAEPLKESVKKDGKTDEKGGQKTQAPLK